MTTTPWNWNSPLEYAPCRLVSPGIYQVTVYCKNAVDVDPVSKTNGFGTLNFKFFHQRTWGATSLDEEWSTSYTVSAPLMAIDVDNNHGNTIGVGTAFEGIYKITLNKNDHTIKAEKMN